MILWQVTSFLSLLILTKTCVELGISETQTVAQTALPSVSLSDVDSLMNGKFESKFELISLQKSESQVHLDREEELVVLLEVSVVQVEGLAVQDEV